MSYNTIEQIQKNWINKAGREEDPFNKFIAYWIAFNCWYALRYPTLNDGRCIKKMKEEIGLNQLKVSFEDAFIEELSNLKLKNVRKTLREGIDKIVPVNENCDVIYWVYIFRNNLFHGNKLGDSERDKTLVSYANTIMETFISAIQKIVIKDVVEYAGAKIAATRGIVGNKIL
jgi:hypothetical protein